MVPPDGSDSLLDFVSSVAGDEVLKVEENLGDGFVRLRVGEAERRQAKHDIRCVEDVVVELLRNSRDAGASHVFLATSREGKLRRLSCIDDGAGIPEHLHELIFEPRVTSKLETMTMDSYGVHGRGMALYSLKTNVTDARVACSQPNRGTALLVVADTTSLLERKDQSTWPQIETDGSSQVVLKGPHNILRTVVEFALDTPSVDVYVGSPSDIIATMRALAISGESMGRLFDEAQVEELQTWHRAGTAVDPEHLAALGGQAYGLPISVRSAQRILAEEIVPLDPIRDLPGEPRGSAAEADPIDLAKDRRSLRMEQDDLDSLAKAVVRAYAALAKKYYLEPEAEPQVTSTADEIRIRLPLRKLE